MNVVAENPRADGYVNDVCPICAGKSESYFEISGVGAPGHYHIDTCRTCEFTYVRNIPSVEFLREAYRTLYGKARTFVPEDAPHKRLKNWFFAKRIENIAKPGRKRVLEIGYAQGNLLKALQRRGGFEIEGIDFGEGPYQYLKSLGLNVSLSSVEDMKYADGRFDIVVGLHVLEHVQDPVRFIGEIRRILSARGRVYLQIPCPTYWRARLAGKTWRGFSPPFHLWYFSPKSIRLFLSKYGFQVLSAHCLSHRAHLTVLAEKA